MLGVSTLLLFLEVMPDFEHHNLPSYLMHESMCSTQLGSCG